MKNPFYWLTTAAQEHVNIVKEKGYTQVNMGPKEPLEKMSQGDWILYYSPIILFEQPDTTCEQFTSISRLTDDHIYPQDPSNPIRWRRNAQHYDCIPQHASQFHQHVDFLKQYENWLDAFHHSVFQISQNDFITIAKKIILPHQQYCLIF